MADIVSPEERSRMMSGIRCKNTKPELLVRKGLHALGFRFRLCDQTLPGKPDLVFPKYHALVFINGCFWHGHNCHLFKWPSTRPEFWGAKLNRNREKDKEAIAELRSKGWRVLVIWECALKGKKKVPYQKVIEDTADWLKGNDPEGDIRGY